MSPMMDANTAIHDDEGAAKKMVGVLETFRKSIRMAAEKSPLLPGQRGLKVSESGSGHSKAPPSPSVTSPLKTVVALFQTKDDDGEKGRAMMCSKTEPNMAPLDSLLKKGASIRRSLKFASWKDKKQEAFVGVQEGASKEEVKENVEEEEVEEVWEEMEETYTLPELPHTPLSVMQINKLIEMEVLEEAHLNLLALRVEFQQEWQRCGQDSSMELAKKEKDLSILYADLRHKLMSIVRTSVSLPSRNKGLLVHVARIVQEEDKRAQEPGGLQGSWMDAWREAVGEGVREKVESIHLEQSHLNASWLAVHLGLLGKAVVEDLEMVKRDIRWSYPPSFRVFSTYVESYHATIRQHLNKLLQQATHLKDLYALLDWIVHRYHSERIMGSPALQPDMKDENPDLQLDEDFLLQLTEKFCTTVKEEMKAFLDRLIELENEDMWTSRQHPDKEEDFFNSDFHMDIWTKVKGNVVNARRIDAQLEQKVIISCLQELKDFPKRFDAAFQQYCSPLRPQTLWSEYHVTYINSFTALLHHMEAYEHQCAGLVETLKKEVMWLLYKLLQGLEDQFKEEVKPYLRRMMTRKWLTNDDDFNQLFTRTELLSRHCDAMRPPHGQVLAGRLHHHVMKEYVGQLMKNNYSCKNRKHEKAAATMRAQCSKLRELFQDMRSSEEWLYPVGDRLSDIIGQKDKADIKNHLQSLLEQYPDFSSTHLTAVLTFRGLLRGREHQQILLRLRQLRKTAAIATALKDCDDKHRWFFRSMEVTVHTDCLSNVSFFCLTLIRHRR
ncbi:exocyst complex component 3-like protein 4 [Dunckerocampus dactyliophorus]|uniref:exocyst complex component 3-like protein 4 n=1 Tax=Dunckerocampus dactyliophorus TaxID=161453 RepID=UPI002405FEC7|nr:exocyst complex component 3-like protein 4 [Dunckerocampus dactyliophorus]